MPEGPRNPELLGLGFERPFDVEYVASRVVNVPVNDVLVRLCHERAATPGEIDCAVGHRTAYTRFLATDAEWALIVEDDAVLAPAQVLAWSERLHGLSRKTASVMSLYAAQPRLDAVPGIHALVTPPDSTVAYFINRCAAQVVVDSQELTPPSDWPLTLVRTCHFFLAWPSPASTFESQTLIGSRVPGVRQLARLRTLTGLRAILWIKAGVGLRVYWRLELSRLLLRDRHSCLLGRCIPTGAEIAPGNA